MNKTVEISYAPWTGEKSPAEKEDQIYLVSSKRLYTSHTYGSDKSPGDTETSWNVQRDIPKTNFGVEQPDGWLGDNISNNWQTSFYSWGLWRVLEITEKTSDSGIVTATVRLRKITRRQTRYGNLVRGWDYRWLPELRDQAEQARKQAGISRTEFLEQAIQLRIAAANTACTRTAGVVPPKNTSDKSEHPGDERDPS